jgi:cellulose biosynthesis protein BcsQ
VLIIDLPAVIAPAMAASFMLASLVLVPAAPNTIDVEGTRRVLALLEQAARERTHWPPRTLLVPMRVREMEGGLEDWRTRLARLGLPMSPPLRHHSEFDTAFTRGSWVGDGFRGSAAYKELRALAERVVQELARTSARPTELPLVPPPPLPWWRRLLGGEPLRAAFSG